jgi:hypothetical protein
VTADAFLDAVVDRLLSVPASPAWPWGARGRRIGRRPASDWDLGVYIDGRFAAGDVRALAASAGWAGHVAEVGEWGPVMNGGAWLTVDGRRVDLLWRDTAAIEHLIGEADAGEFRVVRIPFFLAGIASYVPVGELSINRRLAGVVPAGQPMPAALRERAAPWWRDNARFDLDYSRSLARREPALAAALLTRVLLEVAHARRCEAGCLGTEREAPAARRRARRRRVAPGGDGTGRGTRHRHRSRRRSGRPRVTDRRRGQRPVKRGGRFSRKARWPSR